MTRLYYNCSAPNGKMKNVLSYAEAVAFVERYGGHFKAVYEPIREEPKIPAWQLARRVVARQPPPQKLNSV